MPTNIVMNINPEKRCGTCKYIKIYLSDDDMFYCSNENHRLYSDRYFVPIEYTCKYWETKNEE